MRPAPGVPIRPCDTKITTTCVHGSWVIAGIEDPDAEGEITVDDGNETDDAEPLEHAKDPGMPTQAERERHRCDHYPFRS